MDLRGVSKQWSCETLLGGDRWMRQQQQPLHTPPNPVVSCYEKTFFKNMVIRLPCIDVNTIENTDHENLL